MTVASVLWNWRVKCTAGHARQWRGTMVSLATMTINPAGVGPAACSKHVVSHSHHSTHAHCRMLVHGLLYLHSRRPTLSSKVDIDGFPACSQQGAVIWSQGLGLNRNEVTDLHFGSLEFELRVVANWLTSVVPVQGGSGVLICGVGRGVGRMAMLRGSDGHGGIF